MNPRELLGDIIDGGYPDIAKRIADTWVFPECDKYLEKLILQDRPNRQGFPIKVMEALIDLQRLRFKEDNDIWNFIPKR